MRSSFRTYLKKFLVLTLAGSLSGSALAAPGSHITKGSGSNFADLAHAAGGVLAGLYEHYTSSQNDSGSSSEPAAVDATPAKDYTIMLYLVGSNLESDAGLASAELAEIAASGLDFSRVNFLAYTGGSTSWSMNIPSDQNNVYRLFSDQLQYLGSTESAANTGDAAALSDFLNYAQENYPADHYALICWDHGGGPLIGFGCDDNFDGDSLTLPELKTALSNSFAADHPLDWIGFDACLMSSIELAGTLHGYADYLIASQEVEPGNGWDYGFLDVLNSTYDPVKIADRLTQDYSASLKASLSSYFTQSEITLGCMDLSEYPRVNTAMDALFARMDANLSDSFGDICRARRSSKEYALSVTNGRTDGYDLVDLKDLADHLSVLYPDECETLSDAVSDMVVSHITDVPNTNGISMYFPCGDHDLWNNWGSPLYADLHSSGSVVSFLEHYTDFWDNGFSYADWTLSDPASDGSTLTLQLTAEQSFDVSSASFTLLEKTGEDSYTPIREDIPMKLTGDQLSADLDFLLVRAYDSSDSIEWPARILEQNGSTTLYTSQNAMVSNALTGENPCSVNLSIQIDPGSGVILRSLYLADIDTSDKPTQGREELQLSLFGTIGCEYRYYTPGTDESGHLLPFSEWQETDQRKAVFLPVSSDLRFSVESISSTGKSYALQVVIDDVYGARHASNLIQIL